MKPMLARTKGPKFNHYPCYLQPKLNGIRCLAQVNEETNILQSRDEIIWSFNMLKHIRAELLQIPPQILQGRILDGELYHHGWRLQRINSAVAVRRTQPTSDTDKIEYHVFDVVDPKTPFEPRWIDLYKYLQFREFKYIKPVHTICVLDEPSATRAFHYYTSKGYEGVMLRTNEPYIFGITPHGTEKRSSTLWKYKSWQDGEYPCIAVTQGEGKADIGIGALVLQAPNGTTFKVGTGFSDEERIAYHTNPPIGKLIKIRYLELTADGVPFNASFLMEIL